MPTFCSAYGCTNSNDKESCRLKKISFHRFPLKDKTLLKKWLNNIKRDEKFYPSIGSKLCSDHFEEECFEYQAFTNRRLIKKDAIPTKFVFPVPGGSRKGTSYSIEQLVCNINLPGRIKEEADYTSANDTLMTTNSTTTSTSTQTDVGFGYLIDELATKNKIIEQLTSEIENLKKEGSFSPLDMSDEELDNFSGFDKETFFKLYEFLSLEEDLKKSCKLSPLKQFLFFMCRLRHGFTLDTLAYIFKISEPTASRMFSSLTTIIYNKMKTISIWPDPEQINEFMPPGFKRKYPGFRIIIDCIEFEVQKLGSPKGQEETSSDHKNITTAKALVGIAPSGGISFISDLCCGSVSNSCLFSSSQLLQLLKPRDVVFADKEFTTAKELMNVGCDLVQPLFLPDSIQFTLDDKAYSTGVSNLQVHLERTISRIKYFKYFESTVPYTCFHNLNQIFYIATFLTNFRPPLISMHIMEIDDTEE